MAMVFLASVSQTFRNVCSSSGMIRLLLGLLTFQMLSFVCGIKRFSLVRIVLNCVALAAHPEISNQAHDAAHSSQSEQSRQGRCVVLPEKRDDVPAIPSAQSGEDREPCSASE